ncbi:ankyrin repeat-containing domain protein [Mycena sanguinolenta]|nr:ankyrin repeat-containing domain protein [Mycena sanguinolenta]
MLPGTSHSFTQTIYGGTGGSGGAGVGGRGGVGEGPKIENRFGKIEHFIVNNHGGEQTMNPRERAHIIDWHSPINMFLRQADIFSTWQPGTGLWLLEHDSFGKWKSGTGGILWCKGMPGAGKRSLITNLLRAEAESQNIGVAVLYLNHKETEYSASNLLAAVWRQPVVTKQLPQILERLYRKHQYSQVFILVDGLDEYPEKQRDILLRHLEALGAVHLLFTSRPHIGIDHITPRYESLEIRATADDIRKYVGTQISESSRLSKHISSSQNLRDELEAKVVERSDGMCVLTAKLHLDSLTEKRTVKEVRAVLGNMADDLDIAYDVVVDRINQQSQGDKTLAWRTLSWITHAKRPLRRAELREALAVEPGATELDPENLPDMDIVISVCAGLVVVNEEDDKIRLIHHTTELYLQSAHIRARAFPRAQSEITMTCITYLLLGFEAISQQLHGPMFLFTHNPFLGYAVENCLIHARGEPESQIKHSISSFLAECSVWWRLWKWKQGITRELPSNKLWIAAFFRLEEICRSMIEEDSPRFVQLFQEAITVTPTSLAHIRLVLTEISRRDQSRSSLPNSRLLAEGQSISVPHFPWPENMLKTPLESGEAVLSRQCFGALFQQAALQGATDLVRLLLENYVDLQEYGPIALQEACVKGNNKLISLLIDNKVDINQQGPNGTALHTAAFFGHEKSVRLLVNNGAQMKSGSAQNGQDALWAASQNGHTGIVRLLIEGGADVNANGRQALRTASEKRYTDIIELLIKHGAQIDGDVVPILIDNGSYRYAVLAASEKGRGGIVKLLIDGGANINGDGWYSPLYIASKNGHEEIVKLLVEAGADIEHQWPLYAASERGHQNIVKILIEAGANIELGGPHGPLYAASEMGHEKVVIEVGANIERLGTHTPLYAASERGHEKVVKLLVEAGADIEHQWPLYAASERGHQNIVKILIEAGANIELGGPHGPLYAASEMGHEKVVIEVGANIERLGTHTPLYAASERGHEKVVKLLVEAGADIEHQWLLYAASERGHENIVKGLIEAGVNIDGGGWDSPLYAASKRGHENIVKLLVEAGADIEHQLHEASEQGYENIIKVLIGAGANVEGGGWDSPLYAASECGHENIVKILIEAGANIEGGGLDSPLYAASEQGHDNAVKVLIEAGANIEGGGQQSLLYAASQWGHENVVKVLIEAGANIEGGGWDSPLYAASECGHENVVKILIEAGANIEGGGLDSPLYAASQWGHENIVKVLIEAGANIEGGEGGSPLEAASEQGHESIVKVLIEAGANIE